MFAAAVIVQSGCNRNDTDHLAKIGRILGQRSEAMMGGLEEDFSEEWKNLQSRGREQLLTRRVTTRISHEKSLLDARIEVSASGNQVELKGEVQNAEQKRRAIDLAESTPGVSRVEDRLRIAGQ